MAKFTPAAGRLFTYSNGDRTVHDPGGNESAFQPIAVCRIPNERTEGKFYIEVTFDNIDTVHNIYYYFGFSSATVDYSSGNKGNPKGYLSWQQAQPGAGEQASTFWASDGNDQDEKQGWTNGDILGVAADLDYGGGKVAFYWSRNGVWNRTPGVDAPNGTATIGAGGIVPIYAIYYDSVRTGSLSQATGSFIAADQVYTPAGYTAWSDDAPEVVYETAVLNDAATVSTYFPQYETAELNDYVTVTYIRAIAVLRESAGFSDAATVSKTANATARETAEFRDRVVDALRFTSTLSEAAVVTDIGTPRQTPVTARETARFADLAVVSRTLSLTMRETAGFNDRAIAIALVMLSEEALIADYVYPARFIRETARETAVISDTAVVANQQHTTRAIEVGQLADYSTPQLDTYPSVSDEVYISDSAYLSGVDGGYMWTALISTWAMSRYVGTPFTNVVDDFAATNDGLFIKDGGFGDADIATGDSRLGSNLLKRVRALHMYGEHNTPLTVSVTADVQGARSTNSYTQMARDASDVRAVRCIFGRGYRSQQYQIGVQSEGYARLRKLVPLVDSALRRI